MKQIEIIDELMDCHPENAEELGAAVFDKLVEYNSNALIQISSYKLADLWNGSDAVSFGLVSGKTAADFHNHEGWS